MARGLSSLQINILGLLHHSRGMVRVADILRALWGWQAKPGKERYDGGQVFTRSGIGAEEYDRIHATLSRSLERLRQRGLIRVFKDVTGAGTVVGLTDGGTEVAREIIRDK
jgi:hypothetical protein